jgi:hypothetical protein
MKESDYCCNKWLAIRPSSQLQTSLEANSYNNLALLFIRSVHNIYCAGPTSHTLQVHTPPLYTAGAAHGVRVLELVWRTHRNLYHGTYGFSDNRRRFTLDTQKLCTSLFHENSAKPLLSHDYVLPLGQKKKEGNKWNVCNVSTPPGA